jgi:hypothetical protein
MTFFCFAEGITDALSGAPSGNDEAGSGDQQVRAR